MDKKKLWILAGGIVIALLLILLLVLLPYLKKEPKPFVAKTYPTANGGTIYAVDEASQSKEPKPFVARTYPTANGGTIYAVDEASQSVAFNNDGTSVSDALYEYKSTHGYSVQYNNKYIVDFGTKEFDFKATNSTNTANVVIVPMDMQEGIANIQTKEEWDAFMSPMIGTECMNFNRTPINNMDALVSHYNIDLGNGQVSDVLYVMLIGKTKIYNYIYKASPGASEAEATQIGAILYTIREL